VTVGVLVKLLEDMKNSVLVKSKFPRQDGLTVRI